MEYYSALKRKEVLTHATKWVKLEDIILSEISLSLKGKYYMSTLNTRCIEKSDSYKRKIEQ